MQGRWQGHALYKGMQISTNMRRKMLRMLRKKIFFCPDRDLNASFSSQLLTYSDQFHIFWTHLFWTVLSFYSETASQYSIG